MKTFFEFIKLMFNFIFVIFKICFGWKKKAGEYENLTSEELMELSDEALYEAATMRTMMKVINREDFGEDSEDIFYSLPEPQKVVYTIDCLEREVENGGLCQFFGNSSSITAPFVSEALAIIGAVKHQELFDNFIEKYRINLYNLSMFDFGATDDIEALYQKYPFDDYDDKFNEQEALPEMLLSYIREHIDDI